MATVNQPVKRSSANEPVSTPERLTSYLKGVRAEWTKISWPTWPQVWEQTIVVLVMVTLMTFILFIMDYSFHFIIANIVPHRM
jgi:preprotein translocase SecE subunit